MGSSGGGEGAEVTAACSPAVAGPALLRASRTPADPLPGSCHSDVFITEWSRQPGLPARGGDNKSNYLPSMVPARLGGAVGQRRMLLGERMEAGRGDEGWSASSRLTEARTINLRIRQASIDQQSAQLPPVRMRVKERGHMSGSEDDGRAWNEGKSKRRQFAKAELLSRSVPSLNTPYHP
ncbi:hypothetical protein NQZ68_015179 [Dissostichus eleginoides]|nr:hypothetical protein NQZ68_015179 [Dissostichus eleginoides]